MKKQRQSPYEKRKREYRRALGKNPVLLEAARSVKLPPGDHAALAASHVLAPALACFVDWVLREAVRAGKKRLYFLARDGYLMYHAAKILCEKFKIPIECRYLSCSRYSLRIPAFHMDEKAALEDVCRAGLHVTFKKILYRAGLTDAEARRIYETLHWPRPMEETIPYVKLAYVKRRLAACPEFLKLMNHHSREAFPALAQYLKQEGMLDGTDDAVVDSGWTGSMQKTLDQLLAAQGREKKLEGYYWGMYEIPAGMQRKNFHCFYFSPEKYLRRKVYFNNCFFEAVFTAPHGMTLGYGLRDGQAAPRYGTVAQEQIRMLKKLRNYMMRYIQVLAERPGENGAADAVAPLLRRLMARPTLGEAKLFGSLSFSDDVLEGGETFLAARLSGRELRRNHAFPKILAMYGFGRGNVRESAWYEASAVLGGKCARYHLWEYALYQYVRFLRKKYRRG